MAEALSLSPAPDRAQDPSKHGTDVRSGASPRDLERPQPPIGRLAVAGPREARGGGVRCPARARWSGAVGAGRHSSPCVPGGHGLRRAGLETGIRQVPAIMGTHDQGRLRPIRLPGRGIRALVPRADGRQPEGSWLPEIPGSPQTFRDSHRIRSQPALVLPRVGGAEARDPLADAGPWRHRT